MAKRLPNYAENAADLWVRQRILDFAPDDVSIPAAQKVLRKVMERGGFGRVEATADGKGWWAVCPSSKSSLHGQGITDVYQTSVRIDDGSFVCDCTCPSPKYPCKHALALLLYLYEHPEKRTEPEAPKHAATDFEALVRAVFQNPDDDTPRLIFADFLEENDQPDRAALIRLQCELARAPAKSARAAELKKGQRWLLARIDRQVGTLPEGTEAMFERGFIHLSLDLYALREPGSLPERFTRLFRDGWVEVVRVGGYYYDQLNADHATLLGFAGELDFADYAMNEDALVAVVTHTAEMRATGRLCRVKVSKRDRKAYEALVAAQEGGAAESPGPAEEHREYRGLTRQSLDLLARAGRLRRARQLFLDGPLGDWGAEQLAAANLAGVEVLHLGRWQVGPDGLAALAGSAGLPDLTEFGLHDTRLDVPHVRALASGPAFGNLRRLSLDSARLADDALAELAKTTRFHLLQHLDLEVNDLTAKGVAAFLRSPNFPALTSLSLDGNGIDAADVLPLLLDAAGRPRLDFRYHGANFVRTCGPGGVRVGIDIPTQLREDLFTRLSGGAARAVAGFAVSRAETTPKGLRALARALDPGTLRDLEFRDVALKNEGAEELVAAFRDFRPQVLRLVACRVQASGVAALAGSPLLDSVKTLDLSGNTIGKAGTVALVKSPHLANLQKLELTDWKLGADEKKALKAKLGKKLVT